MERRAKSLQQAAQLLSLADLVCSRSKSIIDEWAKEETSLRSQGSEESNAKLLPSHSLHESQRTVLAAAGMLTELVSEPSSRLLEISSQYFESRALHIVAERRIPDFIANVPNTEGVSAKLIGERVGIEHLKLSRILRCLCSIHVFREVRPDHFDNNVISAALVNNEPLRAYIMLFGLDLYSASDHLPKALLDPIKGPSYNVSQTAFQDAVGTEKPRWEWLEEKVRLQDLKASKSGYPGVPSLSTETSGKDDSLLPRPEIEIFGLAMLGGGRVFGTAHVYDFPWASLGDALIVDVGGGVGGFDLLLSRLYPKLRFVIQDRGKVLEQAQRGIWPKENPEALAQERVTFQEHDLFRENPIKGADVYWLRYILHDWSDQYCIDILAAVRHSMGPNSRVLICDQVMNTTLGCEELAAAPQPLPANYGYYTRYSHQRDLAMMSIINGIERTPAQLRTITEAAGLELHKIWECRSQVSLVELRLPMLNGE